MLCYSRRIPLHELEARIDVSGYSQISPTKNVQITSNLEAFIGQFGGIQGVSCGMFCHFSKLYLIKTPDLVKCSWLSVDIIIIIVCCAPLQAIDAKTIKDVCTKYIYNKAPAIAAVGMLMFVADFSQWI